MANEDQRRYDCEQEMQQLEDIVEAGLNSNDLILKHIDEVREFMVNMILKEGSIEMDIERAVPCNEQTIKATGKQAVPSTTNKQGTPSTSKEASPVPSRQGTPAPSRQGSLQSVSTASKKTRFE